MEVQKAGRERICLESEEALGSKVQWTGLWGSFIWFTEGIMQSWNGE